MASPIRFVVISELRESTNPLYYIVVFTTITWVCLLLAFPIVSNVDIVYDYSLVLFAIWAVLPVAMAYDVGILRQRLAVPAKFALPLIALSALPIVAPVAGVTYLVFRARVVKQAE
jgi:hypothetical protein